MSIQVNTFDMEELKREIKKTPIIVQQYISALERSNKQWQKLTNDAVRKIKELSREGTNTTD